MAEGASTIDHAPEPSADAPSAAAPASSRRARRARPSRPGLWLAATGLAVAAFAGTVVTLNLTLYSPAGFVERYLAAIDRRDLASALETPGVTIPDHVDATLLVRAATVPVEDAHVASVSESGDRRTVTVDWRDGEDSGSLDFVVEPDQPLFGLFSGWRFAETPIAEVPLSVANAPSIRVNGVELAATPDAGPLSSVRAAVLAPSRLTLDYETRYLTADPVPFIAGSRSDPAPLEVQPTPAFVTEVQEQLDAYLQKCATQQVLQPAGCPFGAFIEDRLLAPPTWRIASSPTVTVRPGGAPKTWTVPDADGVAHISGEVQSLFDGTRSPLEQDEPFSVSYTITIRSDGGLQIQAQ